VFFLEGDVERAGSPIGHGDAAVACRARDEVVEESETSYGELEKGCVFARLDVRREHARRRLRRPHAGGTFVDDLKGRAASRELGGLGMSLAEVGRETRRLAMYAPATALCLNMHNYWVGLTADLWRSGDKSIEWLLREAAAGEVFAAGHAETGNDVPLLLSTTKAEKVDGGYKFTGRKAFGSLTPVWTRLGVHGMDTSDPKALKIVHAFMPRDAKGYTIKDTWDVLGMRATRSDDTVLEGVFVPEKYIARIVPAGAAGVDMFVLGIFAWALLNFGNVYYGLASRVRDLTVEHVKSKSSVGLTRSMAYHAEVQHGIAEMVIELEGIGPHLDAIARDWSEGVQHADWPVKIVAAKYHAVEGAFRIVDRAMDNPEGDRKSTRLNSSHRTISYAVFCLKK